MFSMFDRHLRRDSRRSWTSSSVDSASDSDILRAGERNDDTTAAKSYSGTRKKKRRKGHRKVTGRHKRYYEKHQTGMAGKEEHARQPMYLVTVTLSRPPRAETSGQATFQVDISQ